MESVRGQKQAYNSRLGNSSSKQAGKVLIGARVAHLSQTAGSWRRVGQNRFSAPQPNAEQETNSG